MSFDTNATGPHDEFMKILFLSFIFLCACTPNLKDVDPIDSYFDFNLGSELDQETAIDEYLVHLNQYRQEKGRKELIYSSEISMEARGHSDEMSSGKISLGHEGSLERCENIKNFFVGAISCTEIVARGSTNPLNVFVTWKNSPVHERIFSDSRYTHTGISFSKDQNGVAYWTQIFVEMP